MLTSVQFTVGEAPSEPGWSRPWCWPAGFGVVLAGSYSGSRAPVWMSLQTQGCGKAWGRLRMVLCDFCFSGHGGLIEDAKSAFGRGIGAPARSIREDS